MIPLTAEDTARRDNAAEAGVYWQDRALRGESLSRALEQILAPLDAKGHTPDCSRRGCDCYGPELARLRAFLAEMSS